MRIEMINAISGLTFEEVWGRRVGGRYGDVPVNYISRRDLLINKTASGRPKGLANVDELGGEPGHVNNPFIRGGVRAFFCRPVERDSRRRAA